MKYIKTLLDLEIETIDDTEKYFCLVRKSYIPVTPEEKVRQNFLKYLIEVHKFPIDKIRVEESLSHYGKGNRRMDILVLDQNDVPFIIYECKKESEPLTDEVLDQVLDYFNKLTSVEYLGIVIGDNLDLMVCQEGAENPFIYTEQTDYLTLVSGGKIKVFDIYQEEYVRNNWKKPVTAETIESLIDFGVIGGGTDKKFHSFLINLDGWLLNEKDILKINNSITDIGIKNTKFGSAGGVFFAKEFRSFVLTDKQEKPIICIALTSIASGKNSPIGTTIMVGVETLHRKNISLELKIGKSVKILGNNIEIFHNGTITIGKLGAAKKQDLLDFIEARKPGLIKHRVVFLGTFDEEEEINSKNVGVFIANLIDYAILRNEFREVRKHLL